MENRKDGFCWIVTVMLCKDNIDAAEVSDICADCEMLNWLSAFDTEKECNDAYIKQYGKKGGAMFEEVRFSDCELLDSVEYRDIFVGLYRVKKEKRYWVVGEGWKWLSEGKVACVWRGVGTVLEGIPVDRFRSHGFSKQRFDGIVQSLVEGKVQFRKL